MPRLSWRLHFRCEFLNKHDDYWYYSVYLPCLGSFFRCMLQSTENSGKDLPQSVWDIVEAILFQTRSIRADVEQAIYRFYRDVAPYDAIDYGTTLDTEEPLQPIVAPREVTSDMMWTLMESCYVAVDDYQNSPDKAEFDLCFTPSWDEHEVQVRIANWQVVQVDQW